MLCVMLVSMTRKLNLMFLVTLTLGTLAATGCDPAPGHRSLTGDSLSYLVLPKMQGYDYDGKVYPGAKAGDMLAEVRRQVSDPARSPACLVVEFGQNEAGDGVLSEKEKNDLYAMVFAADDDARVVLVKPHRVGGTAAQLNAIDQWRSLLDTLAGVRNVQGSLTIEVDWRPLVQANPSYLKEDGVHPSPEGEQPLATLMQSGCG